MSWLRSAVNKAVEKGGSSNLTRTVRIYADTVVQQASQAVAGGAKLLQDRIVIQPILISAFLLYMCVCQMYTSHTYTRTRSRLCSTCSRALKLLIIKCILLE